jgi:ribose-phosphate pyrophosphokinase
VKTDTIETAAVVAPTADGKAPAHSGSSPDGNKAKQQPQTRRSRVSNEDRRFKIFSGTANRDLAEAICRHIGVTLGDARMQRFSDGEFYFQLLENVRGADVFVIQPTCGPVDQHLIELLIMIDALKRASAGRITMVVPYYGYARQDRKDRGRVAISSKLVADLMTTAGAHRALFMDLHAAQIQAFFNIPVDHMFASPVIIGYIRELNLPELTIVSPDAGGVERARFIATKLGVPMAIVDKRRTDINVTEVMNVIGLVKGRTCLIIDDIVDTAGTLVKTVDALLEQGATQVFAGASHPVLSGEAVQRIASSRLAQLVVTDSIPLRDDARALVESGKIKVLSVAGLLGAAIENIHMETSVSTLFS